MSRGGESGSSSSSISSCPKFSLLTASSLGRLTPGAGETHTLGRNRVLPPPCLPPLWGPRRTYSGGVCPSRRRCPAASSWPPCGSLRVHLENRAPQRPLQQWPPQTTAGPGPCRVTGPLSLLGEKMHSNRLRAAVPPRRAPASGRAACSLRPPTPSGPPELPGRPGPGPATSDKAATGPAPTFQLRQHLELVRKLAVEVVLDAVQLPLIVLHGHADPPSPPESPPAPKLPRHSCAPLPPPASRRRQCTVGVPGGAQPLVGRQGRVGAGLRAQAGWGRVKAWSPKGTSQELAIGPHGCPSGGVGGEWPGVGGALRAGRTWKEVVPWPERKVPGSWVARCGDTGAGSGRVSGIGDPDGAAPLQVGSRVGGGGLTAGIHPEPLGHRT